MLVRMGYYLVMNSDEINADPRVKAADRLSRSLKGLVEFLRDAGAPRLIIESLDPFVDDAEETANEMARFVEVEHYAVKLLDRLNDEPPPAHEDACYGCGSESACDCWLDYLSRII